MIRVKYLNLIVFPFLASLSYADTDHLGADWNHPGGLIAGRHYNIGTFTIGAAVTVNVVPYDGINDTTGMVIIEAGQMIIDGTLSADGAGYGDGGPPPPQQGDPTDEDNEGSGGGGCAGKGGKGENGEPGGIGYNILDECKPDSMGGGGGKGQSGFDPNSGGHGGGKIKLICEGTWILSGLITANGEKGTQDVETFECTATGGGAGGSIWILADTIQGSGTITANGGHGEGVHGGVIHVCNGGGGGGGWVALIFAHDNGFTHTNVSVDAGTGHDAGDDPAEDGLPGIRASSDGDIWGSGWYDCDPLGIEKSKTKYQISKIEVYPNPATTGVRVQWSGISEKQLVGATSGCDKVSLQIYDLSGRLVKTLIPDVNPLSLTTAVEWDGKDEKGNPVKSGVYFCRFKAVDALSQKLIYLSL